MKKITLALGVIGLGGLAASASAEAHDYWIIGIGTDSCAHWIASDDNRMQGDVWIQGFWSGLNATSRTNTAVGSSTDNDGLFAEVRKICDSQPSLSLIEATVSAYKKLAGEGR